MRLLVLTLALAAALVLLAPGAYAWNGVGHMTVAKLAYAQLTDAQKLQADKLLRAHPHYQVFLSKNRPPDVGPAEWAFLRAATWPDWIRNEQNPDTLDTDGTSFQGPNRLYTHDHYINLPVIFPEHAASFAGKHTDPEPQNIVNALQKHVKILRAPAQPPRDKAVSLCWLLHLMGDIHQPLHCVALFSNQFPKGDQGGNTFGLKVDGKPVKLHSFWDDLLGEDPTVVRNRPETPEMTKKLLGEVTQATIVLRGDPYQRGNLAELNNNLDFKGISEESLGRAREVAYLNGNLRGVVIPPPGTTIPEAAPEAPADYQKQATAEAFRRVALAGYRLADTLNGVLGH